MFARTATGRSKWWPMATAEGLCPACGFHVTVPLPVEPLFNRAEVCALVPVKASTLAHWMSRHRNDPMLSPPKYIGRARRGRRLWTAADVRYIRASMVRNRQ